MKNLTKISIAAMLLIAMASCTKEEIIVPMEKAKEVKTDSTATITPGINNWGNGEGQTNNGEG